MPTAARLRQVAGTRWGTRPYINIERRREQQQEEPTVARASSL
ncbi:MAG: hypothetical protein ACUVTW_13830 [Thermogutta sp.]